MKLWSFKLSFNVETLEFQVEFLLVSPPRVSSPRLLPSPPRLRLFSPHRVCCAFPHFTRFSSLLFITPRLVPLLSSSFVVPLLSSSSSRLLIFFILFLSNSSSVLSSSLSSFQVQGNTCLIRHSIFWSATFGLFGLPITFTLS